MGGGGEPACWAKAGEQLSGTLDPAACRQEKMRCATVTSCMYKMDWFGVSDPQPLHTEVYSTYQTTCPLHFTAPAHSPCPLHMPLPTAPAHCICPLNFRAPAHSTCPLNFTASAATVRQRGARGAAPPDIGLEPRGGVASTTCPLEPLSLRPEEGEGGARGAGLGGCSHAW